MLEKILIPTLIFLVSSLLLIGMRGVAFKLFSRWAERTKTKADDIAVKSLRGPSIFWAIALGLALAVQLSEIPRASLQVINQAIYIILIFSFTLAAANLAGRMLRNFIEQSKLPLPATGLAYALLKGIIICIGIL